MMMRPLVAVLGAAAVLPCALAIWSDLAETARRPGVYRSEHGTPFYDDRRMIRTTLPLGLEVIRDAPARPITGGTIEPLGLFRLERSVQGGARITVLSGPYAGDAGWVRVDDLELGVKVRSVEDFTRKRGL